MQTSFLRRATELRSAWLCAALVSVASYGYLLAQFPIGNHDWSRMDGLDFIDHEVELGRWFAPIVYAVTSYRQLPLLNASLAQIIYVTGGFLLARFVEACTGSQLSRWAYAVAGLIAALIPFSNWTLFFSWQAALGPTAQLLCVLALLWVMLVPRWKVVVPAGGLVCLSMASYQATLNTAAVLFWFAAASLAFLEKAHLRPRLGSLLRLAAAISLGTLLYKLSLTLLKALGVLLTHSYHFSYLTLDEIPSRAWLLVETSFRHLLVPHPFFPLALKILLLLLTSVGAVALISRGLRTSSTYKEQSARVAIFLTSLALMIYSTKLQFLASSQEAFYRNRFAAFGLTAFYVLFIATAFLVQRRWLTAFTRGLSLISVWACITQDLQWQDGYVKQNKYDERVLNRVIARIESLPGFSYNETYELIVVGSLHNIRPDFFPYDGEASPYHHYTAISPWSPEEPFRVLEPRLQLGDHSMTYRSLTREKTPRTERIKRHVRSATPWPHPSSVALIERDLVVILSGKESGRRRTVSP